MTSKMYQLSICSACGGYYAGIECPCAYKVARSWLAGRKVLLRLKHLWTGHKWNAGWSAQKVYCKCGASCPLKFYLKEMYGVEGR